MCYHENNVPYRLSPQWFCGNSCTRAHDVQLYVYICMYVYACVCIYIYVCMWELTINGGLDISGVLSFASIRHRKTIIFDRQKTLYLKEAPAKLLKTYLKNNGSICFVDMDFDLIKLLLEIKSSFSSRKISP